MELGDDDEEEDEYQGMPLLESDLPDDDERMAENDMPSPVTAYWNGQCIMLADHD